MGFGMAQRTSTIASAVPVQEIGAASSVLALSRNIAGAFGIALFGTILQKSTYTNILNISHNSALNVHTSQNLVAFIQLMSLKAQILAYDRVFLISSIMLTFGAITAFWIKVQRESKEEIFIE
jgi:hypothetical protein